MVFQMFSVSDSPLGFSNAVFFVPFSYHHFVFKVIANIFGIIGKRSVAILWSIEPLNLLCVSLFNQYTHNITMTIYKIKPSVYLRFTLNLIHFSIIFYLTRLHVLNEHWLILQMILSRFIKFKNDYCAIFGECAFGGNINCTFFITLIDDVNPCSSAWPSDALRRSNEVVA